MVHRQRLTEAPPPSVGSVSPDTARIKVLLITDESTSPEGRAVATRRWTAKSVSLEKHGCEVTLATLRGWSSLNDSAREAGCATLSLDVRRYHHIPRAVIRLSRRIREDGIDVVHGQEVIPAFVGSASSLLAGRGIRVYFRSHTASSWKHTIASWIVARLSSITMGGSEAVGRYARSLDRTPPRKIRIVINGVLPPRGVHPREVEALRTELGMDAGDRVVVAVSRLRVEKGLDVLLRAAPLIDARSAVPVHVVIVGSGSEAPVLADLITSMGLERVHLVGHQDDVARWYALADIVASPSRRDAAPLSVLEAMGCGRPAVASRVGGLPEWVVDGETGVLVEPDDPEELAAAIATLLDDEERRQRLGERARRHFEDRFTIDRMTRDWAQTYRDLVAAGGRR